MKKSTVACAAIALCAICSSVLAMYSVTNRGTWPAGWPAELEPLRAQSRTLTGPMVPRAHYEIPFTTRESFEAAWPHLLKVRSTGAPVFLVRGPDSRLGTTIKAGIRIYAPPPQNPDRVMPAEPLGGSGWDATNVRTRWMYTTFIEVVVDGEIVDLNRIPLPADTPIIDQRFATQTGR